MYLLVLLSFCCLILVSDQVSCYPAVVIGTCKVNLIPVETVIVNYIAGRIYFCAVWNGEKYLIGDYFPMLFSFMEKRGCDLELLGIRGEESLSRKSRVKGPLIRMENNRRLYRHSICKNTGVLSVGKRMGNEVYT